MTTEELQRKILELETKLNKLEKGYEVHQHDGLDGTNQLRKSIRLDRDQWMQVGLGGQATGATLPSGQLQYALALGNDDGRTGFVNKADIMQVDMLHQPSALSFLVARRTPVVTPLVSTVITATATQNTVTTVGFNFVTDELAGALIDIYNSSGTLIETQTIASNNATVITINGAWGATTTGGTFNIYKPVYLGSADWQFQRVYTSEGTAGGIRFGVGATAGALNQNGLLYMDATGDLYWRNKSGTSVKLN